MRSIISAYPMLNQDWLLTGEGNMLVESIEPTCGYLLLNNGISIEMVAKMLGHANIQTTQKVYAKILDNTMDKAFNGLEKRMGIKK